MKPTLYFIFVATLVSTQCWAADCPQTPKFISYNAPNDKGIHANALKVMALVEKSSSEIVEPLSEQLSEYANCQIENKERLDCDRIAQLAFQDSGRNLFLAIAESTQGLYDKREEKLAFAYLDRTIMAFKYDCDQVQFGWAKGPLPKISIMQKAFMKK